MCSDLLIIQMLFDFFAHARFVCVIIIKWCCALIIFIDSLFGHFFRSLLLLLSFNVHYLHHRSEQNSWTKMTKNEVEKKRCRHLYKCNKSNSLFIMSSFEILLNAVCVSLCVRVFNVYTQKVILWWMVTYLGRK